MNVQASADSMWDTVTSMTTLNCAWAHVRDRKAGPGSDRQTVAMFSARAQHYLEQLQAELRGDTWVPRATMRIRLRDDPDRPICVAAVRDRVVQRALTEVLGPMFNRRFADTSFAYRSGWSIERARRRIDEVVRAPRFSDGVFVRMDIRKFFDTIDRHRLTRMLTEAGVCARTSDLITRIMAAGVLDDGWRDTGRGVPQGGALSPLLSNVYLHRLDVYADALQVEWFRYADDILMIAPDAERVVEATHRLRDEMARMGLDSNDDKQVYGPLSVGFDFVGIRFTGCERRLSVAAWRALERSVAPESSPSDGSTTGGAPLAPRPDQALSEWSRWYGGVEPAEAMTPWVLALLLERSKDGTQTWQLARRRALLSATSRPVEQIEFPLALNLARQWLAHGVDFAEVAMLELADALRGVPFGLREVAGGCEVLGVPSPQVWRQGDGVEQWLSWLARDARMQPHVRAIRQRWRCAGVLGVRGDGERLARVREVLFGPGEGFRLQTRDLQGRWEMVHQPGAVSDRQLLEHFSGGTRLGAYVYDQARRLRFFGFRVTSDRQRVAPPWSAAGRTEEGRRAWSQHLVDVNAVARCLYETQRAMQLPVWMEDNGQGVRMLWVLLEQPTEASVVQMVSRRVLDELMVVPGAVRVVSIPGDSPVGRGRGPWVYLPLGAGPQGGVTGRVVDADGRDLEWDWRDVSMAVQASADGLDAVLQGRIRPTELPLLPGLNAAGELVETGRGELDKVLAGCGVMRAWYWKAQRLGHLEPMERQTCFEVLGHLSPAVREDALVAMLERTGMDRLEVRRRLKRVPSMPIACRTVRGRMASTGVEAECGECRFSGLPRGAYPTPVLHAVSVEELPGMVKQAASSSRRKSADRDVRPNRGRSRDGDGEGVGVTEDALVKRADGSTGGRREEGAMAGKHGGDKAARSTGEPTVAEEFEAALDRVRRLKEALSNAERGLARAESQLNGLFDRHGSDAVELSVGRLVRRSSNPAQFSLEL